MGDGEFGVHLNFREKVQQRLCTNGAVRRSGTCGSLNGTGTQSYRECHY